MESNAQKAAIRLTRWVGLSLATTLLAMTPLQARADNEHPNRYKQMNLVSDIPDLAMLTDPDLVNPWGVAFGATSPFWVSDNGTGLATLYNVTNDSSGVTHVEKRSLVVSIPGEGNPTGQLFDGAGTFNGDIFLFVSEDGTISGWRGALGTNAEVLVPASDAIYKGVAIAQAGGSTWLLAANFSAGKLDVFDTTLTRVAQVTDPETPDGYAPFNVQWAGDKIYVTYAKQDEEREDDVTGPGFGFIDSFDPSTSTFERFASGTDVGGDIRAINAPWGVALAPESFGKHGGDLLVGNFGSGTIMAFDPSSGEFKGLLKSTDKGPVSIDGLWALTFGNGGSGGDPNKLYFTAGIDDESHGLFGSLEPTQKKRGRQGDENEDNQGNDNNDQGEND